MNQIVQNILNDEYVPYPPIKCDVHFGVVLRFINKLRKKYIAVHQDIRGTCENDTVYYIGYPGAEVFITRDEFDLVSRYIYNKLGLEYF